MKTQLFFAALFFLFITSACEWFNPGEETKIIELDQKSAQLVNSNNSFGLNLFETIVSEESATKNLMISPLSVSQALSMTLNGAKENTFEQMKQTLSFNSLNLDEINKSNLSLTGSLLSHDKNVTMQIANSIWHRKDCSPKSDFVSNNKTYYNAEVNGYDPLQPEKACKAMNDWVSENTKGKIDQIIDEVKPENVLFLINAIYFKAEWKTQFKKINTEKMQFTLDNGTEKEVQTMIGKVKLNYINEEQYSVVKLPYGSGKFNMLVFLPEEGITSNEIAPLLQNFDFSVLNGSQYVEREIWLPKFEFSYERKLNEDLVHLGMSDAFDASLANFNNMANVGLHISEVKHKTYIKTDEEGTEAAAATSVTMNFTSIGPEGVIRIDRSFLFAIVEEDTNAILFMGRVFDPSEL